MGLPPCSSQLMRNRRAPDNPVLSQNSVESILRGYAIVVTEKPANPLTASNGSHD
jgi:hypothetical protein